MDAKLKADWVAALRSGDYQQGRDCLLSDGAFCCLGVLCDVIGLVVIEDYDTVQGASTNCGYDFLDRYISEDRRGVLIDKNDEGVSFSEIADYIEANIPDDHSLSEPSS